MGLESHIQQTIGGVLWNRCDRSYGAYGFQLFFSLMKDRNNAYRMLKNSGNFNPRKVGSFIIRFGDMPVIKLKTTKRGRYSPQGMFKS